MTSWISNRGQITSAEQRAEDVVVGARQALADLLGCDPGGVVFARSMTQATYDVSRALAKEWGPGDEVVRGRWQDVGAAGHRRCGTAAFTAAEDDKVPGRDREPDHLLVRRRQDLRAGCQLLGCRAVINR